MIEADPLRGNAVLVDALSSALRRGGNALGSVPDLLKRVLAEESWREFVTQRGEHVRHERFIEFVVAKPLRGIGADVELVRRVVADDPQALDLLDQALRNPVGSNQHREGPDNIRTLRDTRQGGTSKDYALRRLRKDAPELHAEVLAGNLTAHAAMVRAGFRPKTFTVRAESAASVAGALRRQLPPEVLAEVAAILHQE